MSGRIAAVILLALAVITGGAMYYLQVYAYYDRMPDQQSFPLTPAGEAQPQPVPVADFRGIDSDSSPIRYRACFTLQGDPAGGFIPYPEPTPLVAPGWFDCFDAQAIGTALETGEARAYLSQYHVEYGIDRVVAVLPDRRAFAWHQINPCGTAHFDGDPVPPGCPPPPAPEES